MSHTPTMQVQYIKDEWEIDIGDDLPLTVVDQSKLA